MPIYKLKLLSKQVVAHNTLLLRFEKPTGFHFKAGQYGGFTLINPPAVDAGGATRRFSLLYGPQNNELAIVTRVQSSAFKQGLAQLAIGSEIKFAGPTGTFILHEDDQSTPAVLIAGGIGISPFYSMICDTLDQHSTRPLYLFYGNQSVSDTPFLAELKKLALAHPSFKLIITLNQAEPDWLGETGFINPAMIKKYLSDIHAPLYYICGSPVMVTTLQETLAEMGIDEDRIMVEDFPGY